ncbi:uncharacterized protein LOC110716669 [Chenopodium quinoa]|uniref:uncharacterized protein LOC110716669 n=1 Tax=Chenopodium quinoa TaxID=63459 RepID=UPI000B774E97|nr:uncharacterized protein LOC110716669 [Chenopodium quinoa]
MNIVAWNCRGLNDPHSLAIPYLVWIYQNKFPMFMFISETKTAYSNAASKLDCLRPTAIFGFDSEGSSGGLLVLSWCSEVVECLYSSKNIILCKISEINGNFKYVIFFYGEPLVENRRVIWEFLQLLLDEYKNVLIIGDFNQVESGFDELGGASNIRGRDAFLDWRLSSDVTEVPFSGPRFTWSNKREQHELILERLDRAYITGEWFNHTPEGRIIHEPIICSDLAVITYYSNPITRKSNRPYQIENWCLQIPEVNTIVHDSWKIDMNGSCMFRLSKKLSIVRYNLQNWRLMNKKSWGVNWRNISKELGSVGDNIDSIQKGEHYINQINSIIPECKLNFEYWRQRMKSNWIKYGDCPTTLMYRRVKKKQLQKEILTLKNDEDTWVEGHDEVEQLVLNSVKEIFSPTLDNNHGEDIDLLLRQLHIPSISMEDREWLDMPFSHQEIKKSMFDMHGSKSPGPDGFTADFFHLYWKEVGQLVIDSVQQFLRSGNMLKEWNQSLLVLIPKVKVLESANHFRPISLCNTIYKCISKCLVNRMKLVLPCIISDYQHAFIPGRYMEDNILMSHELMHLINSKKNSNLAAVKIDMSKAYDRVDWLFLTKILNKYGFSNHWIRMIS